MAQYKVPQDVEADDKLLGPFSFRQFVYLMIAGALLAVAAGLFQLFPLLAIIPLPPVLFFVILALPLKRDQPMETYLAAVVSYYIKPRTRTWKPGQRETAIQITAPKKVEAARTRDITGEEATHRLSFLADIVDTEGYAIKGINNTVMRDEFVAESAGTPDMFESQQFSNFATAIQRDEYERRGEVIEQLQGTIDTAGQMDYSGYGTGVAPVMDAMPGEYGTMTTEMAGTKLEERQDEMTSSVVVMPETGDVENSVEKYVEKPVENSDKTEVKSENEVSKKMTEEIESKPRGVRAVEKKNDEKAETKSVDNSIIDLMNNNKDYSVKTLADQVKRLKGKGEDEIFISLH